LTPSGRRLIEEIFRAHAEHLEKAVGVLDDTEKHQVYEGLKKLGRSVAAQLDK